ncbi:uncharacterized protein BDR25DRAFT_61540 [Lindgomyces ingoldianus]|uniref:Uncharacterized protein n=1 Tax=Lindgomyces ingoldianus TaxID=673940 RepID=A0ACB6QL69_9PLEO|nr:uncharacterized protein BDR25DRAFT_61540 [Lindgomyces ingoldianus]KAF2467640.1 hypothetical protein BDR25DRAFT_61540 [Lindgomyces ingoldianus]
MPYSSFIFPLSLLIITLYRAFISIPQGHNTWTFGRIRLGGCFIYALYRRISLQCFTAGTVFAVMVMDTRWRICLVKHRRLFHACHVWDLV